jgi:hypothetical protein
MTELPDNVDLPGTRTNATVEDFSPGDQVCNMGLFGIVVEDAATPVGTVAVDYGDGLPINYANPVLLERVDWAFDAAGRRRALPHD